MEVAHDPVNTALIDRIIGEYREMPGLALTLAQACRLWDCSATMCRAAVNILVAQEKLHWSRDGRLVRGSANNREALSSGYAGERADHHW